MKKEDFFVDADIRKAETLPSEAFTSVEFMKQEVEMIFNKSWLWIPLDPPFVPNTTMPFEVMGTKLFFARDANYVLRAFPNACTHKWKELVDKKIRGSKIICKYHGRQFGLDGKFILQPKFNGLTDFPRECDNLRELKLSERFGLYFLNFSDNAIDIDKVLFFAAKHFVSLPLIEMKLILSYRESIYGNWKYHIDNYVDELHLGYVHGSAGGLCEETEIESYETKLYENSTVRWVYAKNKNEGFEHPLFPKPVFGIWWHIFPNLTINIWKGGISVNSYLPDLSDPGKTMLSVGHFVWDKKDFSATRKKWKSMNVDLEDLNVVAGVQKVISGTPVPRARFTPNGETACHWFQRKIYQSIFES